MPFHHSDSSGYDHEARNVPFESSNHNGHHWSLTERVHKVARSGSSHSHNTPSRHLNTSLTSSLSHPSNTAKPSGSSTPSNKSTDTIPYENSSSHRYTTPEAAFAKVEQDQSSASHFINSIVSAAQNAASSLAALKTEGKSRDRSSSIGSSFFADRDPDLSETITASSENMIEESNKKNEGNSMRSFGSISEKSKTGGHGDDNDDLKMHPIRHTISTLGKGELSLASLGLDTNKTTPNGSPSRADSTRKGVSTPNNTLGIPAPNVTNNDISDSEFILPDFVHNHKRVEPDMASVDSSNTANRHKRFSKHRNVSKATSISLASPNLNITADNNDEDSSPSESVPSEKNGITGYAYANKKRNNEFHRLFRSVMPDDYLLDDFSCALSRDILIQGRLYVSERHVCFYSNILGWVTTLVIGFDEIVTMEKKNTAVVFPNGIVIQTLHARHSFASFVSRDNVMELMTTVWKQTGPYQPRTKAISSSNVLEDDDIEQDSDAESSVADISDTDEDLEFSSLEFETTSDEDSEEDFEESALKVKLPRQETSKESTDNNRVNKTLDSQKNGTIWPVSNLGPETHAASVLPSAGEPNEKVISTEILSAPLGVVANLLFGDDTTWYKNFLTDVGKNTQLSPIPIPAFASDGGGERTRKYEYIKPLSGPIGPKQTKCLCTDSIERWNMDDSVIVIQTTTTPDVPSGGSFVTKTRTGLCWADNNETKIVISFWMEWSAKSWIKGAVERGTNDGQLATAKSLIITLNSSLKASKVKKQIPIVSSKKKTLIAPKKKSRKKEKHAEVEKNSDEKPGILRKVVEMSSWSPMSSIGVPVWGYLVLVLAIYIVVSFFIWKSTPVAQEREMLRLKEEYEMWKWIDGRVGTSERASNYVKDDSSLVSDVPLFSLGMHDSIESFNYKAHNLQDIVEAIHITERRIKLLKEKLDLD